MKKIFPLFAICLLVLTGCSGDDDNQSANQNITIQALENTLTNHDDWRVTELQRDATNYTDAYNMWSFSFNDDGTVVAVAGLLDEEGEWFVFAGPTTENPNTPSALALTFNVPELSQLSGNWLAVERTGNYVRFQRGDGPEFDYLALSRN